MESIIYFKSSGSTHSFALKSPRSTHSPSSRVQTRLTHSLSRVQVRLTHSLSRVQVWLTHSSLDFRAICLKPEFFWFFMGGHLLPGSGLENRKPPGGGVFDHKLQIWGRPRSFLETGSLFCLFCTITARPEMSFRNWCTANTKHFQLTDSVRWKWKTQPYWVIKPRTHDLVQRIRFWRIKISGNDFKYHYWTISEALSVNLFTLPENQLQYLPYQKTNCN